MFKHNPSILDDLEKERNRMEATKAELEAQILAKQTEMEEKRREHHERQQNHMNSTFLPHDDSGVKVVDNEAIDVETDFANDIPGDIADSVSHEDSSTKTEEERENAPKSSLKRTKIQQIPSNSTATINRDNENPLSLKVILRETIQELRMRITRDFRIVSTFVFPPWAREAVLRKIIFPLAKLTRATGESALDMMKRYLKVVLEDLRKAQQQQKQERQQKEA